MILATVRTRKGARKAEIRNTQYTIKPTMKTQSHISIVFFGEYRPIAVESADVKLARKEIISRVSCPDVLSLLDNVWQSFRREKRRGMPTVSMERSEGLVSVKIAEYQRDTFLDPITAEFPHHPGIEY
jgi:hypothetical protein